MMIELSIVVPAHSEERRIGLTLDTLSEFLETDDYLKKMNVEVIIVAADAADMTKELARSRRSKFKNFVLLEPGKRCGKGRDVQYGILRAKGKYVMFMDADRATPFHHISEFLESCKSGNDLVVGTRDLLRYRDNIFRGVFAWAGNGLYRISGGADVEDTQCGFKMFTARAAKVCFSKLTILGWGFDMEILAIAKANNLTINPIRLNDWQHKPFSTHTDGVFRILSRNINDHFHILFNAMNGRYRDDM